MDRTELAVEFLDFAVPRLQLASKAVNPLEFDAPAR